MEIPDPIELGEMRAEAWEFEMTKGAPAGQMKCACGRVAPEDEFNTLSPDPYARPYCGVCVQEYIDAQYAPEPESEETNGD